MGRYTVAVMVAGGNILCGTRGSVPSHGLGFAMEVTGPFRARPVPFSPGRAGDENVLASIAEVGGDSSRHLYAARGQRGSAHGGRPIR